MMTCTWIPRSWRRRRISAALYAAIPPVTPRAIFIVVSRRSPVVRDWMPRLTLNDALYRRNVPAPTTRSRDQGGSFRHGFFEKLVGLGGCGLGYFRYDPRDLAGDDLLARDAAGL